MADGQYQQEGIGEKRKFYSRPMDSIWILPVTVSHKQTRLMNQLPNPDERFSIKRAGLQRMAKHQLKIDMTPMVDLGFLLISFFVISTELSKPTVMDLFVPRDGIETQLAQSDALTVLLDKNNAVYYYQGDWKEAIASGSVQQTNFSGSEGLRKIIMQKQQQLDIARKKGEGRNGLMLVIKPATGASYKNLVDVLDEITISIVKKYAVVKISPEEVKWLQDHNP